MTDTRKSIRIELPDETWREAKAAAALANVPLWRWIVGAIEYRLVTREHTVRASRPTRGL